MTMLKIIGALLVGMPIIGLMVYFVIRGVMGIGEAAGSVLDEALFFFTKAEKKKRAGRREMERKRKLQEKLRKTTDASLYPEDVELLNWLRREFARERDYERALICAKKMAALGDISGAHETAELLLTKGDGTIATLEEAEQYSAAALAATGLGQKFHDRLRRALLVQRGAEACDAGQWAQALESLREARAIGLDKEEEAEQAARCCCHGAKAQMECAETFRDWEQAYFFATEPGLEKTSFADRLDALRQEILTRCDDTLHRVLELLAQAEAAEAGHEAGIANRLYTEAAQLGSSAALGRHAMMLARVFGDRDVEDMIRKAEERGYPYGKEVRAFAARRRSDRECLEMFHAGQTEKAVKQLRETARKYSDGLSAVEYASLAAKLAGNSSDWKTIREDLLSLLQNNCTECETVRKWSIIAESMEELTLGHEKRRSRLNYHPSEIMAHYQRAAELGNTDAEKIIAQYMESLHRR